ncbi:hypothetical protein ACH5RR_021210 [Cinchona calisaya]|uniref:Uncharacterized protein n=1 Tax=Cinchona calisaya TaxID=153742 RepID=A0ABD2ZIF6_9GENT
MKALNSMTLVESGVVHRQSNEPKIVLDKNRFVSVEAQIFHIKLALIALPCLNRGITFYGLGDDKINTLTAPGEIHRAFLSKISDRTWYKFVREDATVVNDTLVWEFIANTHKLTGTVVQFRKRLVNFSREIINAYYQISNIADSEYAIFKCFDINYDMLLLELCDLRIPKEHVVALDSHSHGQQGTCEPSPPAQLHTEVELHSLAVYHSRSLHALHRNWHFGLPDDDKLGPWFEESDDEYVDHKEDDGVCPSGHS